MNLVAPEHEPLRESSVQRVAVFGHTVKVWSNPTHSVFSKLFDNVGNVLRGTIDDKGDLYVWDATLAIHYAVEQALGVWGHYRYRVMLRTDCINIEDGVDEAELRAVSAIQRAYGNWHFAIENDSALDSDEDEA